MKFKKLISKNFLLLGFFVVFAILFTGVKTSLAKSYHYTSISTTIHVNSDSTLDIEEKQTFNFRGNFHAGERDIALKGISGISDIQVIDETTGAQLIYSNRRMDNILNPGSWGYYAVWWENGSQKVEWYFNLADTNHTWIIRYKVHGAIEFRNDYDRLYWNIFTNYDVPVDSADVSVVLPQTIQNQDAKLASYRNSTDSPISSSFSSENSSFNFSGNNFNPKEAFTIDVGFPKGIVSKTAYYKDFILFYLPYILSFLVVVLSILIGYIYWYYTEKKRERAAGAIVPEYEPPENLPPAMAEIISKEKLTEKGLAATIIDLAVRGYITIEEEDSAFGKTIEWARKISLFIVLFSFAIVFLGPFLNLNISDFSNQTPIILIFISIVVFQVTRLITTFGKVPRSYVLRKKSEFLGDESLKSYERQYLVSLMGGSDYFSTSEIRKDRVRAQALSQAIEKLKEEIIKETEVDTAAFERTLSGEKKKNIINAVLIFLGIFLVVISVKSELFVFPSGWTVFYIVTSISLLELFLFMKYDARLSDAGIKLKKEWLGFKLYLEVAEKYRIQKELTPDLFEKYLPYAMIFGVEKKWAKAFETIQMPTPAWYVGPAAMSAGGTTNSSFSPSAFSASFSSAFTSSFGSSGGGGVGGGGAGGGGGGGGGGAR